MHTTVKSVNVNYYT